MPKSSGDELAILQNDIVACTLCPRLRDHCREIAKVKRRAYLDHEYWGKPVPSFGDPEARVLEDALCLVFLQFQFAGLAARTAEAKTINALQKSWQKMTEATRAEALKLDYGPREKILLQRALQSKMA